MITRFFEEEITYSGEQLQPHYLLRKFGMEGDAFAAFVGECNVSTEALVDWEDRMENETIQSKRMLHFLGEFFGENLRTVVLFQRLFIAQLVEILIQRYQVNPAQIVRKGNDVYVENKKLNVSIVTASPVSVLMHIGINIDPSGAPVPAIGLNKVARIGDKVSERKFAEMLLETFQNEWKAVRWACAKVRPVM